jgi:hypothetical protein
LRDSYDKGKEKLFNNKLFLKYFLQSIYI